MKVPRRSGQLTPKAFRPRDVSGFMLGIAAIQWAVFAIFMASVSLNWYVFFMGLVYGGVLALPWGDVATRGFGRNPHTRECVFYMWFGTNHEILPAGATKCQCIHHLGGRLGLVST